MNQNTQWDRMSDMAERLEQRLQALPEKPVSLGLFERIQLRIRDERWHRQVRRLMTVCLAGMSMVVLVIAYAWSWILQELSRSPVFDYARVLWSDPDVVLANSRDAFFGALEVLPVTEIMMALMFVFFAVWFVSLVWQWHRHDHGGQMLSA